jgi:hypothetical protein
MKRHLLFAFLVLGWAFTALQLIKARHVHARSDARAYMEIQSAYYEGVSDGRKGIDPDDDGGN